MTGTGICEKCGKPTSCVPCTEKDVRPPRATYFKCESCGIVHDTAFMSEAYPNMCEACETKVYEFYGAVVAEGDTLGRDVREEE